MRRAAGDCFVLLACAQPRQGALKRHDGNRSAAGRELGVSPRMMNYRLNKVGIQ